MTFEDAENGEVLGQLADVMIVAGDLVLGTDECELGLGTIASIARVCEKQGN